MSSIPGSRKKYLKKNSPERQLGVKTPPIQSISSKLPRTGTQEEKTTLKLTFQSGITKTFRVFYAGGLERAINNEQILATEAELKEKALGVPAVILPPVTIGTRMINPSSLLKTFLRTFPKQH